jgi:hypothetical protein
VAEYQDGCGMSRSLIHPDYLSSPQAIRFWGMNGQPQAATSSYNLFLPPGLIWWIQYFENSGSFTTLQIQIVLLPWVLGCFER